MSTSIPPKSKKICRQCNAEMPLESFSPARKDNPAGKRKAVCRGCDNNNSRERYERRKASLHKECEYQGCHKIISPRSTYCPTHFQFSPDAIEGRAARKPSVSVCEYPGCNKEISRNAALCFYHFNRRERSKETMDKMSASAKARANTADGRASMSKAAKAQIINPFAGRTHTEESKDKIREKRALQVFSDESIKKRADAMRGKPSRNKGIKASSKTKAQISSTLLSKRDHLSLKAKERYARETEEQHEQRLKPWIEASQQQCDTSIEIFVAQHLDSLGIEYETQKKISYYTADFYIPSRNIILETNGCYWHGCPECGFNGPQHLAKRQKEQVRTDRLEKKGYTVIILWEHEIRNAMQGEISALHLSL